MIRYKDITSVNLITSEDVYKIHMHSNPCNSYLSDHMYNQGDNPSAIPFFQRSNFFVSEDFAKAFRNSTNKILIHDSRDLTAEYADDIPPTTYYTMSDPYQSFISQIESKTNLMFWLTEGDIDWYTFNTSLPFKTATNLQNLMTNVADQYHELDINKTIDIFVSIKEPDELVESELFVQQVMGYYDSIGVPPNIRTVKAKVPLCEEVLYRVVRTLTPKKIRIHVDILDKISDNGTELNNLINKKLNG